MELVRSRFRLNSEHTSFFTLFFFLTGILIRISIDLKSFFDGENSAPILFGFFALLAGILYTGYSILKVPKIVIDQDSITLKSPFKTIVVPWNQIKSISLTDKRDRGFLLNSAEVSVLHLIVGGEIIIWANFYKNISEIRRLLENVQNLLKDGKPLNENIYSVFSDNSYNSIINPSRLTSEYIKLSGNPHTSFSGILFYGFSAFIISIPFTSSRPFSPIMPILFIPILIAYFSFGYQLNYFIFSANSIIIKNHFGFGEPILML
jgi:hypothetical protein